MYASSCICYAYVCRHTRLCFEAVFVEGRIIAVVIFEWFGLSQVYLKDWSCLRPIRIIYYWCVFYSFSQ